MNPVRLRDPASGQMRLWAFLLLVFALMVAALCVLRYGGLWIEQDSSGMTALIENVRQQGTLLPTSGRTYDNGFAYQAVSSFVLSVTGLSVQQLQATIWPLLTMPVLTLAALAFFAQSARDRGTMALAGLLLFFQGDLLFTILRGSHEKLGWPLTMVALALLIRGAGLSVGRLTAHVFAFYLVVFAMIANNVFFASTFIVAVLLSLLLGVLSEAFLRRRLSPAGDLRRLVYVVLSCVLLLFILTFYLYPPALRTLRQLAGVVEQVSATMLGFSPTDNPYQYVALGWINNTVYLGLTLFTWLLIVGSFVEWLSWAREILRGDRTVGIRENLVWLLYAGFAIQVAIGVVVDFSGVLSQNLQLRIFPGFTVMAVVLLAHRVRRVLAACQGRRLSKFALVAATTVLFGWFSIASVLKATNEPALSNKWVFYSVSEAEAIEWADGNVQSAHVWTGLDERIYEAGQFQRGGPSPNGNTYSGYVLAGYERYILFSEREHLRGTRMGLAMPPVVEWNRAYDNGDVYLYHRRPQTPYQR